MSASRVCSPRYTGTTIEIVCSPTTSMDCRTAERITRPSCAAEGVILTSQGDDLAVWGYSSDRAASPFLRSPQLGDWTIHGSRSSSTATVPDRGRWWWIQRGVGTSNRLPVGTFSWPRTRPSGRARSPIASCSVVSREVRPRRLATASAAATPAPQTRYRYPAVLREPRVFARRQPG
jgi:hypothetical protein